MGCEAERVPARRRSVPGGYKYRDLALQVAGLDAGLTTLLCKHLLLQTPEKFKTG
jgi:hypothetical protein